MKISPELPLLVVPELKTRIPLAPSGPLFTVKMAIAPLDEQVPSPLRNEITPPVLSKERPPKFIIPPPAPLVPQPAVIKIEPP
jgi:hypothetical protein